MIAHDPTTPVFTVAIHRITFKYRIYPTKAQEEFLNGQLREACSLYNAALEERIGAWKICRKSINYYDQANQLKAMRADGCLALVNYNVSQDVLRRLDKAFKRFFSRVNRGDKPGYPRFRSSRRYDSLTFPNPGHGYKLLDTGKLRIQGAGHIKIKLHRPVEGKIKTLTIKRDSGRWFACFGVEREIEPLPISVEPVGVDLGLTTFATLSNGLVIENPRFYQKSQAKIRITSRKVSRRKNGSNRRRKAVLQLQRAYMHVRNQRTDFQHKESRKIINQFGIIAVEKLQIENMSRSAKGTVDKPGRNVRAKSGLNRSIFDAGWGQFLNFISYKAADAGREVIHVDPQGTSQMCTCGASVPKKLQDRWHLCSECGRKGPRDLVSAEVILQRGRNGPSPANVGVVTPSVRRESIGIN